jgi:hypothetical protein
MQAIHPKLPEHHNNLTLKTIFTQSAYQFRSSSWIQLMSRHNRFEIILVSAKFRSKQ